MWGVGMGSGALFSGVQGWEVGDGGSSHKLECFTQQCISNIAYLITPKLIYSRKKKHTNNI